MTAGQPHLFDAGQDQLTSDDYYTPPHIFERLGLTFDLDVCAPPGGIEWVPAKRFLTMAEDGLTTPWVGRVWCNPPYSQATPWVRKFIEHGHGIILVPHAKSGWHVELWNAADGCVVTPQFSFVGGWPFLPVWFAAFGPECVEAIGNLGRVR